MTIEFNNVEIEVMDGCEAVVEDGRLIVRPAKRQAAAPFIPIYSWPAQPFWAIPPVTLNPVRPNPETITITCDTTNHVGDALYGALKF